MPTNANAYNSRVTDESLEKRFRDTFRSQGGAELVNDLYAQGVIVPVVDFTAAATGDVLGENLQTAWDFSTGFNRITASGTTTLINNAGFWQIELNASAQSTGSPVIGTIQITDGLTSKKVWEWYVEDSGSAVNVPGAFDQRFVVYLRSGDSLTATGDAQMTMSIWYRQIATLNGDLVNPSGFTSS